ncbi:MAG: thioredoxin [Pseudobutyrivibrio sp.]|nr:thioredoxin [Pseudobutyrivibrio sp.]
MEYKFTKDNFDSEVLNSDKPVLIDFYADWCMPCKMMGPAVSKIAEAYDGQAKVGKINVDQQPELAGQFGVRSIPFFAVIKNGKVVASEVGAMPQQALEGMLKKAL